MNPTRPIQLSLALPRLSPVAIEGQMRRQIVQLLAQLLLSVVRVPEPQEPGDEAP